MKKMYRDYMGAQPITNAKKPVKSGFGDTARYSVGYDKIKQAKSSLMQAQSVLSGTEFEDEVGEALSKVTDIMNALEAKGETLS